MEDKTKELDEFLAVTKSRIERRSTDSAPYHWSQETLQLRREVVDAFADLVAILKRDLT